MAATAQQDMGRGSVRRWMLQLALPAVVAQVINLLYNIVDRIYIGHLPEVGATALTGVGLCMPILMLLNAFAMLCGAGGAPRAAIAMGQQDNRQAERIMGNCFSVLVGLAVVLTIGFYTAAPQLLTWFGASSVTLPYALAYTRIYVLGSLFVLLVMGMNPFVTTQGFAKFSMLTTVIGAVCNIVLDPILIFGFNMGGAGRRHRHRGQPGRQHRVGAALPHRQTQHPQTAAGQPAGTAPDHCGLLGAGHAAAGGVCTDFQQRPRPGGLHRLGHAHLHAGYLLHRVPGVLPAKFRGPGPGR